MGTSRGLSNVFERIEHDKWWQDNKRVLTELSVPAEFITNLSYEIRTPLNGVLGMTECLLEMNLSSDQREYLELLHGSALSLRNVVDNLLDYSHINRNQLELSSSHFSIRLFLAKIVALFEKRADCQGIFFKVLIEDTVPDSVESDRDALWQILINVIGNAFKFTPADGEVRVRVACVQLSDNSTDIIFEIVDTGIGVEEDKRDAIFKAFVQADGSLSRSYSGLGLGLTIAAEFTALLKGKIWLESPGDGGAKFCIRVPTSSKSMPTDLLE